jgi:hypothetical protein
MFQREIFQKKIQYQLNPMKKGEEKHLIQKLIKKKIIVIILLKTKY